MFWCPGPTGVGFGVPFFVSGLYNVYIGKLADRIFFACPGPTGVGFGAPFFVSGKLADTTFFGPGSEYR